MPVARYFLYVGGVLLALLFVIDSLAPREPVVASNGVTAVERPVVRISSTQKLPERVVYDTSLPIIVPATSNMQIAAPQPPALSAQSRVRNTFAQFGPESGQAAPEFEADRRRRGSKARDSGAEEAQNRQGPFVSACLCTDAVWLAAAVDAGSATATALRLLRHVFREQHLVIAVA